MLDDALRWLRASTPDDALVFEFTQPQMGRRLKDAAAKAGFGMLRPEPYQLRHSGPSHDVAVKFRRLNEVKLRGRWRSDASVRRYQQEGRAGQQLSRLPGPVRARALTASVKVRRLFKAPSEAP